jgi:hypothetical protein
MVFPRDRVCLRYISVDTMMVMMMISCLCKGLDRPLGFQVEAVRFQDNQHVKVVRSTLNTGPLYSPGNILVCMISGLSHKADEILDVLRNYAAYNGNSLPMLRDSLLVPSSVIEKMGLIGCPKTLVKNYQYMLHNFPEECRSNLPGTHFC